jgi:hypothetical protein
MLILFDHGTPAPLRSFLKDHIVKKTKDLGWDTPGNGELLSAAQEADFEIFLTTSTFLGQSGQSGVVVDAGDRLG